MSKRPVWVSDDEALILLGVVSDVLEGSLSKRVSDVLEAVEVRLGVIVNGLADNEPVVLGSCGHPVEACCDDGNSFCPKCEGSGDFCRVCSEAGHRFGMVCEGFCPSCSLGRLSTCAKCFEDFPNDELSNEMVCRACLAGEVS